jgi:hypothetical protein
VQKTPDKTFEETYNQFITEAKALKEATDFVEMTRYRNYYMASLDVFRLKSKTLAEPEAIDQAEGHLILKGFHGGLMYADKYEGPGFEYDINSMYPAMMVHGRFQFPIKKGTRKILGKDDFYKMAMPGKGNFFSYGIYHCRVSIGPKSHKNAHKLFAVNQNNYYTHHDLNLAKDLNMYIQLIDDGKVNAIQWQKDDLIMGRLAFRDYVDLLFPLKQQNVAGAKKLLNTLWGSLSRSSKQKLTISKSQSFELHHGSKLLSIKPTADDDYRIEFVKIDTPFKNSFGRISAFLTAFARKQFAKMIEPYADSIVRIQTDGFISTSELPIKVSADKGAFKLTNKGRCKINHVNNITWCPNEP